MSQFTSEYEQSVIDAVDEAHNKYRASGVTVAVNISRLSTIVLIVSFLPLTVHADLPSDLVRMEQLLSVSQKARYLRYDFSSLLIPQSKLKFLGFIGPEFKRLKIEFSSVSKSKSDPELYVVRGRSQVGENSCDFRGTIKIQEIREVTTMHFGTDDEFKGKVMAEGALFGAYQFKEDASQKGSGIFIGTMAVLWYLDIEGRLHYDDLDLDADSYRNNQYIGKWTSYKTAVVKKANWGEYRIPDSGDLDIGVGEFGPNPKYVNNGWQDRVPPR